MPKKKTNQEYEKILEQVIIICKELNRIPKNKELMDKRIIGNFNGINNYCKEIGFNSLHDYLRSKGFKTSLDLTLNNNKIISIKDINLDNLYELVEVFIKNNNYCPKMEDFSNKNNLPCWETVSKILKDNHIPINDFFLHFGREDNPRSQLCFYNTYIDKYKDIFNKVGYINSSDLNNNNYGLPTANWLVNNCPNKNIKTYNQFIEWCGFKPHVNISKDMAIKIIYEMQSKLDRPITAKDFDNPNEDEIGIRTIWRIWGEVWKMQEELGLEITGKHANKYSIEEIKNYIIELCNNIYNLENRKIITYSDIRENTPIAINIYQNYFNKYMGITLRDFIKSIGFDIPKEGNGMNYTFNDGEKVRSQFEFEFSNYLRKDLSLQYNTDYFRDVKYKIFTECNNNSNCDYVINYNGKTIYIEIAGMLKPEKKDTFRTDIYKSKSKEKYRQKLIEKENMFIKAGLEYYILFTCDLNNDCLNDIFNSHNINIYKDVG